MVSEKDLNSLEVLPLGGGSILRIDKVFRFKVTADYAEGGWHLPEYYFCGHQPLHVCLCCNYLYGLSHIWLSSQHLVWSYAERQDVTHKSRLEMKAHQWAGMENLYNFILSLSFPQELSHGSVCKGGESCTELRNFTVNTSLNHGFLIHYPWSKHP